MAQSLISAPQPEAVEAGARVLKKGGNAIDAAITCALVQGVVDPQMCVIASSCKLRYLLLKREVINTSLDLFFFI